LASCPDEICEGPHLRRSKHAENSDPYIKDGNHPGPLQIMRSPPEQEGIRGKHHQTDDKEVLQIHPAAGAEIEGNESTDGYSYSDIDIRQADGFKSIEEQSLRTGLANDETGNDQEQVGKIRPAAREVAGPQIEEPGDDSSHLIQLDGAGGV